MPTHNGLRLFRFIVRLAPVLLLVASTTIPVAGPSSSDRYVYRQVHMGMQVRIVLYAHSEAEAQRAARAGFAEIARLEAIFSNYRATSEISRVVEGAGHGFVAVSVELFDVLERAQRLAAETDGAFDVTAGALTEVWRRALLDRRMPDPAAIAAARAASGWRSLHLDSGERRVRIATEGMRLDLGGIAKGYILDRALAALRTRGIDSAMVEAGGDLVAGPPPPGEPGWRVRLAHASCDVVVRNQALSTSGDSEQFVVIDGVRYSHTVDPRTGVGLTGRNIATVIAPEGATADGLATALTVIGAADREPLLRRYPEAHALVARWTAENETITDHGAHEPSGQRHFAGCH